MSNPWDNDPIVSGPWDSDPVVSGPWDSDPVAVEDAPELVSGETYGPITPEERQRRIDALNAGIDPDSTGIWETIKSIPSEIKAGAGSAMGTLFNTASGGAWQGAIGYDEEEEGKSYLEKLEQERQVTANRVQQRAGDSEIARAIGQSSTAMGEMIPALVGGAFIKGVTGVTQATQAVLGIMAGTYGPGYYNEARKKNKTVLESLGYTAAMTGAEIGMSALGMKVAGKLGGKTLVGIFGSGKVKSVSGALAGTAAQGGEEVLTQYVQNVIGTVSSVNPEAWENLGRQTWDNFAVGTLLGASANVPGLVGENVQKFLATRSRSNARKVGLGETSQEQREEIAKAASDLLTADDFKKQIKSLADDGGPITATQADYLIRLTEARARAAGESLGDYVGKRIKGVERAKWADFADRRKGRKGSDETVIPSAAERDLGQPAYHGSPYKFDKFTLDKIGTGEGAQAYGWGLYFAGNDAVARFYRDKLTQGRIVPVDTLRSYFTPGRIVPSYGGHDRVIGFHANNPRNPQAWYVQVQRVEQDADGRWVDVPGERPRVHATQPDAEALREAGLSHGALYKVDLKPTDDELLHWDKPLSEQSEGVKEKLRGKLSWGSHQTGEDFYRAVERGQHVMGDGSADQKRASQLLHSLGIRGIKYLDGGSRGKGEGSYNYVIFDDADVVIEDILAQQEPAGWGNSGGGMEGASTGARAGEIEFFADDGRAVIRAFEQANFATMVHELGHLFRRDLADSDLKAAESWAGVKDGKWDRNAEEKFARGFENYMRTGKHPHPKMRQLFKKFRRWLSEIYSAVTGSAIDVNIPDDMRAVYDNLFASDLPLSQQPANIEQTVPEGTAVEPPPPEPPTDLITDRFRGLANHAIDTIARKANFDVDEAMGDPKRIKQPQEWEKASKRVASNPDAERQKLLSMIEAAETSDGTINLNNLEDTIVASQLIEATALAGYRDDSPDARILHRRMHRAYRQARTAQAQALGYRDPVAKLRSPAENMQRMVMDAMSAETVDEITARKEAKSPEEHAAIDQKQEERYQAIKQELLEAGIDIRDMESWINDGNKVAFVLDKFDPKDSTLFDRLFEYWRNSILSGPRTHTTNVLGNVGFSTYHFGVERPFEAFVNLFTKNPKNAQFGELKPMLQAAIPAMRQGLKNAKFAWKAERSILAARLGREELFKFGGPRRAIAGTKGKAIRIPYRMLAFADEFAKTITSSMEVSAQSYRIAKSEGLDPKTPEFQDRMNGLVADTQSEAWDTAYQKSLDLAFQGHHGALASGLSKVGKGARNLPVIGKPLHFVIAFVDTPASILEQGVKRSAVFGDILDILEYTNNRRSGLDVVESGMTPMLARRLMAWGSLLLLWPLVDDENPIITGASYTPEEKALLYRTGRQPQSIRIGDNYYSYGKIEPFATAIGLQVDLIRGLKSGEASKPVTGLIRQVESKSYMEGLGDMVEAFDKLQEGNYNGLAEWAGKFAGSWIPNIYRSTISSVSGEVPERSVWAKGWERVSRIVRRSLEGAGLADSKPRFDVWGRRMTYNSHIDAPATSFFWNLLSPINAKSLDMANRMDLALMNYRAKHPDSTLSWREPPKYFTHNGRNIYLSDDQYAAYSKMTGELALQMASQVYVDVHNPTEQQIKNIKSAVTKARSTIRNQLKLQWFSSR